MLPSLIRHALFWPVHPRDDYIAIPRASGAAVDRLRVLFRGKISVSEVSLVAIDAVRASWRGRYRLVALSVGQGAGA